MLLLQNPLKKNLRLHRKNLKAVGPPKNQGGSNIYGRILFYELIVYKLYDYLNETKTLSGDDLDPFSVGFEVAF